MPINGYSPTSSRQEFSLGAVTPRQQGTHLLDACSVEERWAQVAGESWSCPWCEFVRDVALDSGVDAVAVRRGDFKIGASVTVAFKDRYGAGLETGWTAVRLPSIDGKARAHDVTAPQVVIAPDGRCLIWQPRGTYRDQRRIGLGELCSLLGDMADAFSAVDGARRRA